MDPSDDDKENVESLMESGENTSLTNNNEGHISVYDKAMLEEEESNTIQTSKSIVKGRSHQLISIGVEI